jgi:hypothetical protein
MSKLGILVSIAVLVPIAGIILYAVFKTVPPENMPWDGDASGGADAGDGGGGDGGSE